MTVVRAGAVGIGLVAAVLIVGLATGESGPHRMTTHLVGEPAPAIAGTTIDGDHWDLDDQRGRWVVVNFFSTTCVPCVREHPELVSFHEAQRSGNGVRVVSVAFDDRASAVEAFFRERGGDWPVLAAATGGIAVDWGVVAVPESYLVAPSGHVAAKVIGGVDHNGLDSLLTRVKVG